jgi:hypothetical protein
MRLQKFHKTFAKEIDKAFGVSFSSSFFCFVAFSGVSQQRSSRTPQKNVLQKDVSKIEKCLLLSSFRKTKKIEKLCLSLSAPCIRYSIYDMAYLQISRRFYFPRCF